MIGRIDLLLGRKSGLFMLRKFFLTACLGAVMHTAAVAAEESEYAETFRADLPWVATCSEDFVSREISCRLSKTFNQTKNFYFARKFLAFTKTRADLCFEASENSDPRFSARLSVDGRKPVAYKSSTACGLVAKTILGQMLEGKAIRVQTHRWPSSPHHPAFMLGETISFEAPLDGFREAWQRFSSDPQAMAQQLAE